MFDCPAFSDTRKVYTQESFHTKIYKAILSQNIFTLLFACSVNFLGPKMFNKKTPEYTLLYSRIDFVHFLWYAVKF